VTIQGTVLADYQALVAPVPCGETLAIYKAMNALKYDVAGVGNHEFNYGLGYLAQVTHTPFNVSEVETQSAGTCGGPSFPQVLSNVFSSKTMAPLFQPTAIVEKIVNATFPDGSLHETNVKIGFMAFAPPPIVNWDKRWLDGKVFTKGVKEVAADTAADLKARGADLVIGIVHGGLDNAAYSPQLENQGWHLAHCHQLPQRRARSLRDGPVEDRGDLFFRFGVHRAT
jgi:2',3'-cyclic-nucleotide 2'-phosphodiesterase / 3'-nucleotidase